MKFLRHMQKHMTFRSEEAGFFLMWGTIFGGVPFVMLLSFLALAGVETLSCQRVEPTQVSCQITQSNFLGLWKQPGISFSRVRGAKVNQETAKDGDTFYQVVLQTNQGEVALTNSSVDTASQINQFMNNSQDASLVVNYDSRMILFWICPFLLLFIIPGFTAVFYGIRTELRLR